jgi:hypothetical protein
VDEITLWVKCAVSLVAVYLDKLFENSRVAANAFDGKASGIVPVTKDGAFVLIIGILGTKQSWTD